MNRKQAFFTTLCIVLVFLNCDNSTKQVNHKTENNFIKFTNILDNYAKESLKKGNINTLALAVYKNGEMYQNYYGYIDMIGNKRPTNSSLFEIASITKTFTGALISKAVIQNKINLNDDIRNYLIGNYPNLQFNNQPITIKHLLTHTLGLENKQFASLEKVLDKIRNNTYNPQKTPYTINDALEELKSLTLNKLPGSTFEYSFIGPELLAHILENVNKESFEKQLNKLFSDIGMTNSYLQNFEKHSKYIVKGYEGNSLTTPDYNPLLGGAGGVISSLPDMARYMQYLIENKEKSWVKEATKILYSDKEDDENIGYLWQNIGFAEEEGYYYSKTGTSKGTQSGILICPDSNYGIVLIANNTSDNAFSDWITLFFSNIEPDIIKYPRLNLFASIKPLFESNLDTAFSKFRTLKKDTINYYLDSNHLNSYGYQLLADNNLQKAISIFKFITKEFPNDSNAYDSLGEAYFINKDYKNAYDNYKKSLELNATNENAKSYLKKIEILRSK